MRTWFWLTLFLLASVNAYAEPVRFGSFLLDDEEEQTIILAGPILRNAPLDLRRALKAFPEIRTMALHSEGGDVMAGLLVAQEVFDLGLDTRIAPVSYCYSACAFVYFAGARRTVQGELGVHQMAGGDQYSLQLSISDMLDTLAAFDVPPLVISEMLRTSPENMRVYDAEEAERVGLNRHASKPAFAFTSPIVASPGSALLLLAGTGESGAVPLSGSVWWRRNIGIDGRHFVVAKIQIPDGIGGFLGAQVVWRRNHDPRVLAEALIEIEFYGGDLENVVTLAGILTKQQELVPGQALVGTASQLTDSSFVFEITNNPSDATENAIRLANPFIDLAFILANGRNGILTFGKDGESALLFRETVESWAD